MVKLKKFSGINIFWKFRFGLLGIFYQAHLSHFLVLGYAIGGLLIDNYGAFSILSPFYFFAFLNLIWVGLFSLIAHDSPTTHPTILQDERDYIERSIDDKQKFAANSVKI